MQVKLPDLLFTVLRNFFFVPRNICIATPEKCDWFISLYPNCYIGLFKEFGSEATISEELEIYEANFVQSKVKKALQEKPLVSFILDNKMVKPFDMKRKILKGLDLLTCTSVCYLEIEFCSFFYLDGDICYIGQVRHQHFQAMSWTLGGT